MFVNIGLQNGVLLRTVLDPVNGQLTDTRTRYVGIEVPISHTDRFPIDFWAQDQFVWSVSKYKATLLSWPCLLDPGSTTLTKT